MKIAIPSTGQTTDSSISPFFGRCPFFIIVEIEDGEVKNAYAIENPAMEQPGGAGISASQLVGNQGVIALIAGSVGPRAMPILQELGIKIYKAAEGTVDDNIKKYIAGELEEVK